MVDVMHFFLKACLGLLHAAQLIWTCVVALLYQPFVTNPVSLESPRSKLPHSLVLVLSTTSDDPADDEVEKAVESVICAARCCMRAGIECLGIYDKHGITRRYSSAIKASLSGSRTYIPSYSEESESDSDSECPTPEFSLGSDSRPMSPGSELSWSAPIILNIPGKALFERKWHRHRQQGRKRSSQSQPCDLKLSIFSYESSKPHMAALAGSFAISQKGAKVGRLSSRKDLITVNNVDKLIQDYFRLPAPELMIVHPLKQSGLICSPLELHGFPPWLLRLTEIYYDDRPSLLRAWRSRGDNRVALSEETFRRALDQFAQAEMRVGT